jgi:hypothetical protein
MTQTKADLTREVVAELGALGSGQAAPNADDVAFIESRIVPIIDELRVARIITIASVEAIPDYAFPDLVRIVAEECSPKFHRPTDKEKLNEAKLHLARIAQLNRTGSTFTLAVLEQLEAMNAATPTIDAVMVTGRVPAFLSELATRGVIYLPDVETVEGAGTGIQHAAFNDLAKYVAANLASPPLYPVIAFAEGRLRQLTVGSVYPVLKTVAY